MGNWLKGRVLISDVSLIAEGTQQGNQQVVNQTTSYQVSRYLQYHSGNHTLTDGIFIFVLCILMISQHQYNPCRHILYR